MTASQCFSHYLSQCIIVGKELRAQQDILSRQFLTVDIFDAENCEIYPYRICLTPKLFLKVIHLSFVLFHEVIEFHVFVSNCSFSLFVHICSVSVRIFVKFGIAIQDEGVMIICLIQFSSTMLDKLSQNAVLFKEIWNRILYAIPLVSPDLLSAET